MVYSGMYVLGRGDVGLRIHVTDGRQQGRLTMSILLCRWKKYCRCLMRLWISFRL